MIRLDERIHDLSPAVWSHRDQIVMTDVIVVSKELILRQIKGYTPAGISTEKTAHRR